MYSQELAPPSTPPHTPPSRVRDLGGLLEKLLAATSRIFGSLQEAHVRLI